MASYEKYDTSKYKQTVKRAVKALNAKVKSIITHPQYKFSKKIIKDSKEIFFENHLEDFPMSRNTYYKHTAFANDKAALDKLGYMGINTFYNICKYTDVSADYLFGFISTTRKEPSAELVKQDYGLSDKSMEMLARMNDKGNKEYRFFYDLKAMDFMNFLMVNLIPKLMPQITTYLIYMDAVDRYPNEKDYSDETYRSMEESAIMQKYVITQTLDKFLDELRQEALKNAKKKKQPKM